MPEQAGRNHWAGSSNNFGIVVLLSGGAADIPSQISGVTLKSTQIFGYYTEFLTYSI